MEVLILIGLVVLNGIFAMSEIALITSRKARLMKLAAEDDRAASIALKLGENPTQFLSTVQIGITSIGILNGIVGEAALAAPLSSWLHSLGMAMATASAAATAIVVIAVTYISIVVGELAPKRLGQINPERIARIVARPIQALAVIAGPFVALLTISTNALLRLIGIKQSSQPNVAAEEIRAILEEGTESGEIEQQERDMVRNVFRLDDRRLASLMIPRSDVVFIDINQPADENLHRLIESEHSRFPVCDGSLDNMLGVIHAKQALAHMAKGQTPDFSVNLHPVLYVPETLTGMELLEQFRANNMQMAFVIDEYGEIEGVVTLQDVLEIVTGEFTTNNEEDAWAVQREDSSWLLDGTIPIPELKDHLQLKSVPEEQKGRYHTLSGMIMLLLGRIPSAGDQVSWQGWRFEVVDMDQKRIDKVLAIPLLNYETSAS
ncbi:HlyC/CorC family transporter [Candidimonas sp. SYP-B2681]|uniref:hemolysin family protein n=1 Tax=Candidimonas sp. SYP-B2681 TaxID=2497686 RepID=UPI000F894930|nr:hemolysin family protein [Candidimonas sp. SYP-B2681]RTZ48108.1 HlyC/CorC family transporter [Candidimonas sp. SYP-B2681]